MTHSHDARPAAVLPGVLAECGVWYATYLSDRGYPVLVAVDAFNRRRHEEELSPGVDILEAVRTCWAALDPLGQPEPVRPSLTLLRGDRPA